MCPPGIILRRKKFLHFFFEGQMFGIRVLRRLKDLGNIIEILVGRYSGQAFNGDRSCSDYCMPVFAGACWTTAVVHMYAGYSRNRYCFCQFRQKCVCVFKAVTGITHMTRINTDREIVIRRKGFCKMV